MKISKVCIVMSALCITLCISSKDEKIENIKEGNFALPSSQQMFPLFSFGQNIVNKGDLLACMFISRVKGVQQKANSITPGILYGVTDSFSLFMNAPVATKLQSGTTCSSGIEDIFIQGEYAFHTHTTPTYQNQTTLVTTLFLPTGSSHKQPPTGFGSCSFFLGVTASHLSVNWHVFAQPGTLLTTSHHGTKFGDQFFYEFGVGKNFAYAPDKFVFSGMLEFDGTYTKRNKICGTIDPNSGGNVFSIAPSLWFSTQRLVFQAGISFPVSQHLFGIQNKNEYWAAFNIRWKF